MRRDRDDTDHPLTEAELRDLRDNLSKLSGPSVVDFYRSAHRDCAVERKVGHATGISENWRSALKIGISNFALRYGLPGGVWRRSKATTTGDTESHRGDHRQISFDASNP